MSKFIQDQSLFLLEKLNELDLDSEAHTCDTLREDAERLHRSLMATLTQEYRRLHGNSIYQ